MADERFNLSPKDEVSASHLMETWINAVIFDLIKYDAASGKYQIKSRGMGGRALRGWLVDMGSTRQDAFRYPSEDVAVG